MRTLGETLPTTVPRTGRPGVPGGTIHVRAARGEGMTPLSAFDDALHRAGVADHNLLTLSSVIPPATDVVVGGPVPRLDSTHGDRLYCVLSFGHADLRGDSAWAGLGWVNGPRGGLFVEHHSGSEQSVRELIDLSLADMTARRGGDWGPVHQAVVGAHCTGLPTCALVVATYATAGWDR